MLKYSFFIVSVLLLFVFCQSEAPLPNTPETVSKQWQDYINDNQFEAAKKLSTPNAEEWLTWIQEMIVTEEPGEELPPPVFLKMDCKENGNKATCVYLQEDVGEQIRDSFFLLKINGQWLVDIPEEDLKMEEGLEELIDQMEGLIKEESQ